MAKSRAEIQRAYRQRKKEKEGEAYAEKERKRVRKYYVPIAERSRTEQKTRREKVRRWVQAHRRKQKAAREQPVEVHSWTSETDVTSTTGDDPQPSTSKESSENALQSTSGSCRLLVKMPFALAQKEKRSRTRVKRESARLRHQLSHAQKEAAEWKQKCKRTQKRLERLKSRVTAETSQESLKSAQETEPFTPSADSLTPRKRVAAALRAEGLSPSKVPKGTQKKLLLAEVLTDELNAAAQTDTPSDKGKVMVKKVISGPLLEKYRLKRQLSNAVRMDRRSLKYTQGKLQTQERKAGMKRRFYLIKRKKVIGFLERDDNSRQMPGKKDCKKSEGEKKQTRILNDIMQNLYLKFVSENPDTRICRSSFHGMRPAHIALTRFLSRNKCLCQRHQNMALRLKAAKAAGASVPINTEEYAKMLAEAGPEQYLEEITADKIKVEQWRRVECKDQKKRMKVVDTIETKDTFCSRFKEQSAEFAEHVVRIKEQYQAMAELKKNLPERHVIVQMDFSENYSCKSADEIQSAYFNPTMVTLHPVVIYFNDETGSLTHRSIMIVSDELGHNASTVFAFIKAFIPRIKEECPGVEWIHYWTDSPTSQYRNKYIFAVIADHKSLFGMSASWNYWESGHGKGPCDGLGGVAKRMADLAVRQDKAGIQDAEDFFTWAKNSSKSVYYMFVQESEIAKERDNLQSLTQNTDTCKGTMKVHAVHPVKKNVIFTRDTSCYCQSCLSGDISYCSWTLADMAKKSSQHGTQSHVIQSPRTMDDVHPSVGDYVAATYQGNWYIGLVKDIDTEERDCQVTFMDRSKKDAKFFKWPTKPDMLWVCFEDVLCIVKEPVPTGRFGRTFELAEEDAGLIVDLFKQV